MNQTNNYQLSQWDSDDRIMRTDFNADNAKVDAALADHAAAIAEQAAQLSGFGNCQFYTSKYTGDGTYGEESPCSLSFPKKPMLVMLTQMGKGATLQAVYDCDYAYFRGSNSTSVRVSWDGNTMSWYGSAADAQMNSRYTGYLVLALLAADE